MERIRQALFEYYQKMESSQFAKLLFDFDKMIDEGIKRIDDNKDKLKDDRDKVTLKMLKVYREEGNTIPTELRDGFEQLITDLCLKAKGLKVTVTPVKEISTSKGIPIQETTLVEAPKELYEMENWLKEKFNTTPEEFVKEWDKKAIELPKSYKNSSALSQYYGILRVFKDEGADELTFDDIIDKIDSKRGTIYTRMTILKKIGVTYSTAHGKYKLNKDFIRKSEAPTGKHKLLRERVYQIAPIITKKYSISEDEFLHTVLERIEDYGKRDLTIKRFMESKVGKGFDFIKLFETKDRVPMEDILNLGYGKKTSSDYLRVLEKIHLIRKVGDSLELDPDFIKYGG